MEPERLSFLYGDGVEADDWDLDDLEVRSRLLEPTFATEITPVQLMGFEIVANQIFADDPAEVWPTAQRLLALGLDRDRIFTEIAVALGPVLKASLDRDEPFDVDSYEVALERLPIPAVDELAEVMIDVVRSDQGISADDWLEMTLDRFGRDADDEIVIQMAGHVMDRLVEDLGPLAWTAGDHAVHVGDLTSGIVLTHRLTDTERATGVLDASFDLAGFHRVESLVLATGEPVRAVWAVSPTLGWAGPEGWLDGYTAGALLAIGVTPESVVEITELAADPAAEEALVRRLRHAYDLTIEEPWLPVGAEGLILATLLGERSSFDEPRPPLSELSDAAGLERRGDEVAHDPTVWHNDVRLRRAWRVFGAVGHDRTDGRKVLHALDVADLLSGVDMSEVPEIDGPADDTMLRAVLADLRDKNVFSAVSDELFEAEEPNAPARAATLIDALVESATRSLDRAIVRLLAALHAERSLEPLVAEQHLQLAHGEDPGFGPVVDRLGWYASDRGEAAKAASLWRRLDPTPGLDEDLAQIEQFTSPTGPRPGRNDPCPCGSGRKFKQCHLGSTELPPLPDRVGWLCRKAVAFLERRGGMARADVVRIAHARAVDHDRASVVAAMGDPIVCDLALHEGGWFEQFLAERGELLPDDEALLARSWQLVDRTVYEVFDVRLDEGLELRDLRSGDRVTVKERAFTRQAGVGTLVCARAVPDGDTHQLVGGLFPVSPGHEAALLDLLDEGDPERIADWVAALYRPPTLSTREGEASVQCELVVDVGDGDSARAFLDATYETDESTDDEAWVELFPINDDEDILRARLRLDGSRLAVTTTSEERADRVLSAVLAALPDASVVSDRRSPVDVGAMMRRQGTEGRSSPDDSPGSGPALDDPAVVAAMEELRDRFEQRWCDESIPALHGLTPRQSAADPTRRDELVRLVASFESSVGAGPMAMRPERLRELLGL